MQLRMLLHLLRWLWPFLSRILCRRVPSGLQEVPKLHISTRCSQLKPAERARAARVRVPKARKPTLAGSPRTTTNSHEQPRTTTNSHEQPRAATSSHEQPRTATSSHEQPRTAMNSHEQARTATNPVLPAESARAQRACECPSRESRLLLGRSYVCSCLSCVGCGPSSSCNALRNLRKRRMVLLLLPWLRLEHPRAATNSHEQP